MRGTCYGRLLAYFFGVRKSAIEEREGEHVIGLNQTSAGFP